MSIIENREEMEKIREQEKLERERLRGAVCVYNYTITYYNKVQEWTQDNIRFLCYEHEVENVSEQEMRKLYIDELKKKDNFSRFVTDNFSLVTDKVMYASNRFRKQIVNYENRLKKSKYEL